jgi:glycine cleavage system aminomethyltransferase T
MKATFDVHVGHPEVYPVQVQGPKSKDVMRDLFDDPIPYYRCEQTDLDSIPIVISRLGWIRLARALTGRRPPS